MEIFEVKVKKFPVEEFSIVVASMVAFILKSANYGIL